MIDMIERVKRILSNVPDEDLRFAVVEAVAELERIEQMLEQKISTHSYADV